MSARDTGRIFGGQFAGARDRPRLSAQIERIRAWAIRVEFFTLREAKEELERLYAPILFPEASISAQLRNLEKSGAGKLRCRKEKRWRAGARGAGSGVWLYKVRPRIETGRPAIASSQTQGAASEKISWPATFEELEAAGFSYTGTAKTCACGAKFLWFITPRGKWMPLTSIEGLRLVPHRAVCELAKQSHAANAEHDARANPRTVQTALF